MNTKYTPLALTVLALFASEAAAQPRIAGAGRCALRNADRFDGLEAPRAPVAPPPALAAAGEEGPATGEDPLFAVDERAEAAALSYAAMCDAGLAIESAADAGCDPVAVAAEAVEAAPPVAGDSPGTPTLLEAEVALLVPPAAVLDEAPSPLAAPAGPASPAALDRFARAIRSCLLVPFHGLAAFGRSEAPAPPASKPAPRMLTLF